MPKVSVIIPNYNHARFLDQRILSVLGQTWRDMEVLILDDASTDNSIDIIEKYRGDPRVRIVVNKTNSGSPFPQWNLGVKLARGEYIWIAEADDDAEPELLETLVHQLDTHPSVVLAYCQSWVIDEHGSRLKSLLSWTDDLDKLRWKIDFHNNGSDEVRRYLIFKNTIPNASAVVFRRSAFLYAGGATTSMQLCGDWMTWVSLACRGDVAFTSAPLNLFREHAGTVRSSTSHLRFLHEWFEVLAAIEVNVGIPNDLRHQLALKLLNEWRSECLHRSQSINLRVIFLIGTFLSRMDRATAIRFFLLFLLRKALGRAGLRVVYRIWTLLKCLRPATPATQFEEPRY